MLSWQELACSLARCFLLQDCLDAVVPAGVSGCADFIRCVHRFALESRLFQEPVYSIRLPEHHNDWRIYWMARLEELNLTERNAP